MYSIEKGKYNEGMERTWDHGEQSDPLGSCVYIDGVMYPIYGNMQNTQDLVSGRFENSDVVCYWPQESEMYFMNTDTNQIERLFVENIKAKTIKVLAAALSSDFSCPEKYKMDSNRDYPWFWMYQWISRLTGNTDGFIRQAWEPWVNKTEECQNTIPTKYWTCLWGKPRPHRVMAWEKISHIRHDGCIFHGTVNMNAYNTIPFYTEGELFPFDYGDYAIDLVSETDAKNIFYTEKLWRPVSTKRIPLIFAGKGYYERLFDYGYTPHPEIDYSFDQEEDVEKRFEMILSELEKLMSMDLQQLWSSTAEIRHDNFVWFVNFIETCDPIPPPPDGLTVPDQVVVMNKLINKLPSQNPLRHLT